MSKLLSIEQLIEKEYYICCPFLTTDSFISYCKDRDVNTSRSQLEQLERLGIFAPVARVKLPRIKIKIEIIENGTRYKDHGILEDGEEWDGDIKEDYAGFSFKRNYAESWLKEGILWEPSSRDFEDWENFYDKDRREFIISYYSIFQCYTLHNIISMTKMYIHAEWWSTYSADDIVKITSQISDWSKRIIDLHKTGTRGEIAPIVCQVLSNRFFPKTQTDRRTINLSVDGHYFDWKWSEYCQGWNSQSILNDLSLTIEDVKKLQQLLTMDAQSVDPLQNWYGLISFVSLEEKKKLKGKALLAQLIYSMEHMLRLFYKELTKEVLFPPDENYSWKKDAFYGEGVTGNNLQYLEFLTNQYHLNPRPKLILMVEGNGEEEQFPRLAEDLLGYTFSGLGIEIININGVAGFTGKKGFDRYGALEKFIDNYHNRQTMVFLVLDNEGRALTIKNKLIKARSKFFPDRFVTKSEYIHLWEKKTVEFDNFSFDEIAKAMSEINAGAYTFTSDEIKECYLKSQNKDGDCLSTLYAEKTNYSMCKPELLRTLVGYLIKAAENNVDVAGILERPIVKITDQVIRLAALNHYPSCLDSWTKNQESGYFGDIIK